MRAEPSVPSPFNEGVSSFLWNVVVEARVDCSVDCGPWHTSGPKVLESETDTIFEVVSRIEDECMPDHEDIFRSISKTPTIIREDAYPKVATYSQSNSVVVLSV